jgi:methylmalonyl-CoA mutase N-terminal domain/subunit
MRQYAGYASAEESNARYRFLPAQGQSGLSVAFDLPTQIGYDGDDLLALVKSAKWASAFARWITWLAYSRAFH